MRERFHRETRMLRHAWAGMLWAMEHRLINVDRAVALQIRALRKEIEQEFGMIAAAAGRILGPLLWWTSIREEKHLRAGRTYEPATIVGRRNWADL